jgi:hypothetical protein
MSPAADSPRRLALSQMGDKGHSGIPVSDAGAAHSERDHWQGEGGPYLVKPADLADTASSTARGWLASA